MQATNGAVVSLEYTLTDDNGTIIDSSQDGAPLSYLHGYNNIIPGLEQALEGAEAGFEADVVIEPADAYGERDPNAVAEISKEMFPEGMEVSAGMPIEVETADAAMCMWVVEVRDETVILSPDHPLAGMRLHFDVKVVDVREASPEELTEGCPQS